MGMGMGFGDGDRDGDGVGGGDKDGDKAGYGDTLLAQPPQSHPPAEMAPRAREGSGHRVTGVPAAIAPPGSSMHRGWPTPTCSLWWPTSPSAANASLSNCCRRR